MRRRQRIVVRLINILKNEKVCQVDEIKMCSIVTSSARGEDDDDDDEEEAGGGRTEASSPTAVE